MMSYVLLAMVLSEVSATLTSSRVVRTRYGDVSGVIATPDARHLDSVEIFRGIPYAAPPVGNLRFMPPVTGALWTGVKLADKFAPVCPQRLPDVGNETAALRRMPRGRLNYVKRLLVHLRNQSEDCLYLNIYVPVQVGETNRKFPVLVIIHGESYEWNSGNPYDGTVLASYGGLLVVTINYRLGILGFLNTNMDENSKSPSNYGLMDQIAALHWLQENVSVFGGDPTNVTLMGHGTGAACVNFLMTSSAVPDGSLFHRAILMSGSSLSPWALIPDPMHYTKLVTDIVNCSITLPQSILLKCLRNRPLEAFLNMPLDVPAFTNAFGPSIDGVVIDNDLSEFTASGVDDDLLKLAEDYKASQPNDRSLSTGDTFQRIIGRLARYDLLLGVVPAESFFVFNADDIQYGIEADRRSFILKTFIRNVYQYHLTEILATIINEYTDWEKPVQHPVTIRDGTLEALSDAEYIAPVLQIADFHSSARRNSYLYVFDYQTKFGDYQQRQGCVHGEELAYVMGAPLVGGLSHFPRNYTKSEMLLSEATILYWSNFAKTGTPNGPADQEMVHGVRQERNRFKNIEWTAYETVHKKYLSLVAKILWPEEGLRVRHLENILPSLAYVPSKRLEMLRLYKHDLSPFLDNPNFVIIVPGKPFAFYVNDIKPKLKNHFRAHKLSFWLNLVPELHKVGSENVPMSHHMFKNDVGKFSFNRTRFSKPKMKLTAPQQDANELHSELTNDSAQTPIVMVAPSSYNRSQSPVENVQEEKHSTTLILTVVIGSSLLMLNLLIFLAVYYRDKWSSRRHRCRAKRQRCGSFCSVGNAADTTPDVCSKIMPPVENGGIKQNFTSGSNEDKPSNSQKFAQLPSILKKPSQQSNQSSMLILQPSQHLDVPIELTTLKFSAGRSSTLPKPPPPPRIPECSGSYYKSGTLDRKTMASKEYDDMRV